ncbi:MAG TPA: CHAT domain-containing protein [Methylomirabilota bacterium]|nr:CHAT domain-containing protein [Methylomirabilota bacterium]
MVQRSWRSSAPHASLVPLAAVLLLAGCQSAVPVEEAKKIAPEFAAPAGFVPPPRTVEDITAILDQQKRADPTVAERARARADETPPAGADPVQLSRFYFQRALSARAIGRSTQEIEDLRQALANVRPNSRPPEHEVLFQLSLAEVRGGNLRRSVQYREQAIAKVPFQQRGRNISLLAGLVVTYANQGDLKGAETALGEIERLHGESKTWKNIAPEAIAGYDASLAQARGVIQAATGRYAEAERFHRQAAVILASDPVLVKRLWVDEQYARLANVLMRQGRVLEAENEARRALLGALAKTGRYSTHTAWVLGFLVQVIMEQGRYAEAEKLAQARIDIYEQTGVAPESSTLANARVQLAVAIAFQKRWDDAMVVYETLRADLAAEPEFAKRFLSGNLGYAIALLQTGHPDDALPIFTVALERNIRQLGDAHPNTGRIRGLIAEAYAAKGDRARALKEFREAVPLVFARGATDAEDETTTRGADDDRMVGMLRSYIALLSRIRGTPLERDAGIDATAEAFRLAEVVRGRSVERALDASAARTVAGTPALADLVRREQDVRKQAAALQGLLGNLLSAPTDQQDPAAVKALRVQIDTLRRERQALSQQIDRDFPAYAQLVNPPPTTLEVGRRALQPGEALISILVLRNRTLVWAIPASGPVAFASVSMTSAQVEDAVTTLRKSLDPSAQTVGDIPPFDVAVAHRLYRSLLAPVQAGWRQAESLLFVPHGALGQLPLSLLVTEPVTLGPERGVLFSNYRDVPWLIRRHAVTVLPSVGALATLRGLLAGDPKRRPFVGFGDPLFSEEQARRAGAEPPSTVAAVASRGVSIRLRNLSIEHKNQTPLAALPRLPDTADEIRSMAQAARADLNRDIFLGAEANTERVKRLDLTRYRIVAFATHGLVPGDLDGLVQPALALSAPEVAKVGGNGLLTMEDILGLRLNADWVVLSACNTASGNGAGAEAVSGLGRAFFYAGARALLVSSWPVETTSARALTTDLFRRQSTDPRLSRAKALQQTLNALIDTGEFVDARSGQPAFSYAHSIFWAPFLLVGDGGETPAPRR